MHCTMRYYELQKHSTDDPATQTPAKLAKLELYWTGYFDLNFLSVTMLWYLLIYYVAYSLPADKDHLPVCPAQLDFPVFPKFWESCYRLLKAFKDNHYFSVILITGR